MNKYALIGHPVTHSLSPALHQAFAKQVDVKLEYVLINSGLDNFVAAANTFQQAGGKGFNVTAPFKRQAWELMDSCSPDAEIAQAVNTVAMHAEGRLYGHNTDGIGLIKDLVNNQQFNFFHKRILLLGAGGAAYGVMMQLLQQQPAELIVANRHPASAVALCEHFSALVMAEPITIAAADFSSLVGPFDLIINATSASLHNELPAINAAILAPHTWCYDMAYNKTATVFQSWAKEHGVKQALNGMGMLVEQAAEAFFHWHGICPDTHSIINALRG